MRTRALVPVLALLACLLAVSGTASAAGPPKLGKLVAGPTKSGATLHAADWKHGLCLAVRVPKSGSSTGCSEPPSFDLRHPEIAVTGFERQEFVSGAVRPSVAAVEVVLNSGRRATVPTSAGAYAGRYAGRYRFFIAEFPGNFRASDEVRYARLLDAAGNLIAIADEEFRAPRVSPISILRSGRVGRSKWRLRAFQRQPLASVPRDEERFETSTCVDLGPSRFSFGPEVCRTADLPDPDLDFQVRAACSGARGVGLVSSRVRSVVAVLGSGQVRSLRLTALPAALGGGRAFALATGSRTAVRRVSVRDAAGRTLQSKRLSLEPGTLRCNDRGSFFIFTDSDEGESAGSGSPRLQVRDLGARLCITVTAFSPFGRDCALPPLDQYGSRLFAKRAAGSTLVAGVLPGFAERVEVVFADGGKESIPATFAGPYSGRYQGTIRFFSKEFRGNRLAAEFRVFDSSGHRAFTTPGPDSIEQVGRPQTLLRGPGGLRVGIGTFRVFVPPMSAPCVVVGHGHLPVNDPDSCFFGIADALLIAAPCKPRQIEVTGALSRRTRSVTFLTTRGRVRAKIARFHAGDKAGVVMLATIPRRAGIRGVVVRTTKGVKRSNLSVPSAASQCGWSTVTDL